MKLALQKALLAGLLAALTVFLKEYPGLVEEEQRGALR
jgi:hypothetical protein